MLLILRTDRRNYVHFAFGGRDAGNGNFPLFIFKSTLFRQPCVILPLSDRVKLFLYASKISFKSNNSFFFFNPVLFELNAGIVSASFARKLSRIYQFCFISLTSKANDRCSFFSIKKHSL